MKRRRRRKCRHCGELYRPDARTQDRQQHCSAPECKRASKAWRQRRWLSKPENQDYFRGPQQVARVQRWRQAHPGYWQRKGPLSNDALQDDSSTQPAEPQQDSPGLIAFALQDDWLLQPAVVVGLIASLTGSALQDDIALTLRRIHARGQTILGRGPGIGSEGVRDENEQTRVVSPTAAQGADPVQLGRPPPGPG